MKIEILKKFLPSSKVNPKNKYSESQEAKSILGEYEKAEEKLRPRTHVERMKDLVSKVVIVRSAYPYLSILLGVVVAYFASELFVSGFGFWVSLILRTVIVVFVFGIIAIIENVKISNLERVFRSLENGGNIKSYSLFVLFLVVSASILVSSYGGFSLSFEMNDKSEMFNQELESEILKARKDYEFSISSDTIMIASCKKVFERYTSGRSVDKARTDLKTAQENIKNKKATLDLLINDLENDFESETKTDTNKNVQNGLAAGFMILFCELFYVWSFFFEFKYLGLVRNENRQFNILESAGKTIFDEVEKVVNEISKTSEGNQIGFVSATVRKGNTVSVKPVLGRSDGYEIVCKNCNKKAVMASSRAKFCSPNCRKDFHRKNK